MKLFTFKKLCLSTLLLIPLVTSQVSHAALFEDEEARKSIIDLRMKESAVSQRLDMLDKGLVDLNKKNADLSQKNTDLNQKITDLNQKISDLSKQITDLNQQNTDLNQQNTQLKRSLFVLQNQIDEQVRQAQLQQGSSEKLTRNVNDISRNVTDLTRSVSDLSRNMNDLTRSLPDMMRKQNEYSMSIEKKLAEVEQRVSQFEPVKYKIDGIEMMVDPRDKKDFESAMAAFKAADFIKAERGFGNLVTGSPKSPLLTQFFYWLANSQYASGNFKEAIQNYRAFLTRAGNHPRAPEALLGIANSAQEIKDNKTARKALQDLVAIYPDSELVNSAKSQLKNLK